MDNSFIFKSMMIDTHEVIRKAFFVSSLQKKDMLGCSTSDNGHNILPNPDD